MWVFTLVLDVLQCAMLQLSSSHGQHHFHEHHDHLHPAVKRTISKSATALHHDHDLGEGICIISPLNDYLSFAPQRAKGIVAAMASSRTVYHTVLSSPDLLSRKDPFLHRNSLLNHSFEHSPASFFCIFHRFSSPDHDPYVVRRDSTKVRSAQTMQRLSVSRAR